MVKKEKVFKPCEICKRKLEIKKDKIGSGKGKSSVSSLSYSDDGVFYEDGKVWFCNSCYSELFKGANIDYRSFL